MLGSADRHYLAHRDPGSVPVVDGYFVVLLNDVDSNALGAGA
ncbi:MAG: hypothetical protein ACJAZO_005113 [Myxococcota bacterium]